LQDNGKAFKLAHDFLELGRGTTRLSECEANIFESSNGGYEVAWDLPSASDEI
jgi:hypothetical protein